MNTFYIFMPTIQHLLEKCKNLVSSPDYRRAYLIDIPQKYRGITGYFSNYIPEEIIAAAGLYPLRIIGFWNASKSSQRTLFNPVCSFVKDVYLAAYAGEFAFLKNIVFPNSCDSLKVLRQIWEYEIKKPPVYTLLHPINADENSVQYFAGQLRAFAGEMKRQSGADFTNAELKQSIDKYNLTRGLLRQLYDIRKTGNFLKGADAVALMTAGLIMERDEYNAMLRQVINEGIKSSHADENLKRIMVMGPLMDNYALLEKIEQLGAVIIDDDITNGRRYCSRDVVTSGDLYENLAKRYLSADPSPTLNSSMKANQQAFQRQLDELDLQGVIYINQKFCEPHVHNYLAKLEVLKQRKKNILMLEIEHAGPGVSERDLLRIESFIEIAGKS
ncbi:MAG: 2-hydroxyacyl-CoA dehydratase family protein [Sedimentisphaerales bacterium]